MESAAWGFSGKHELAILEKIERLTSARQTVILPMPSGLNPAELLTEAVGYGWTYVNAAFCYTRETGNRFNGPERGAWYAGFGETAVVTAQMEVSWHLTRELEATGVYQDIMACRELLTGVITRLHDLNGSEWDDALNADPAVAYPVGQTFAQDVLASGGNGLL